jgi:hypothetical protein
MARTDQPISETAVANMAATTLEDSHITSLDEDSVLGRFMASQFGYVRDELLRLHPWSFAKKRIVLSPLEAAPAFGWTYQYQLPSDCLRALPLRQGGYLNGKPVKFEREGSLILTNDGPVLPLQYIRRVTTASEFEPLFARVFGERLAVMASQRITGKASYTEKAMSLYQRALADAFLTNALDGGTPEDQDRSNILDVRLGG